MRFGAGCGITWGNTSLTRCKWKTLSQLWCSLTLIHSKLTFSFSSISTAPIPQLTLGGNPIPFYVSHRRIFYYFVVTSSSSLKKKKTFIAPIPIDTGEETYSTFLSFITLLKIFSFKFFPEFAYPIHISIFYRSALASLCQSNWGIYVLFIFLNHW